MIWDILSWLFFGALAGWIAGLIMKRKGSLLRNIILGVVGAVVGGALASSLGISGGFFIRLLVAVAGSCIILFIGGLFSKRR